MFILGLIVALGLFGIILLLWGRFENVRPASRRKRIAGSGLILIALVAGGLEVAFAFAGSAVQKPLPFWMLRAEADYGLASQCHDALVELSRRLSQQQLTKQQSDVIISEALKMQATTQVPWDATWGDFIEQAQRAHLLSQAQWKQYLNRVLVRRFSLTTRPKMCPGDPLVVQVGIGAGRGADTGLYYIGLACRSFTIDNKVFAGNYVRQGPGIYFSSEGNIWTTFQDLTTDQPFHLPKDLSPGDHQLTIRLRQTVCRNSKMLWKSPVLASAEQTVRTTIHVIPANQPTVQPIFDPTLTKAMHDAFQLPLLSVQPHDHEGHRGLFDYLICLGTNPVPAAFATFARTPDGKLWNLNLSTCVTKNNHGSYGLVCRSADAFRARYVDIILKPRLENALNTLDITRYWAKPIVFKHVQVDWSQVPKDERYKPAESSATQPASQP